MRHNRLNENLSIFTLASSEEKGSNTGNFFAVVFEERGEGTLKAISESLFCIFLVIKYRRMVSEISVDRQQCILISSRVNM